MIERISTIPVLNMLGNGLSYKIIIGSIIFSLVLFFYVLTVGSYFNPTVYPLLNRVTYSTQFAEKYFINKYYDSLIIILGVLIWLILSIKTKIKFIVSIGYGIPVFISLLNNNTFLFDILSLSSIPLMIFFIILNKVLDYKILFFNKQLYINYFAISCLLLGIISIIISIVHIIEPKFPLPSINYLYYIFLLFSIVSPILLIMVGLFVPIKWLSSKFEKNISLDEDKKFLNQSSRSYFLSKKTRILYLSLIISLSVTITLIPHFTTINKDDQIIGDDSKDYLRFINPLVNSTTIYQFLEQAFIVQMSGDRPLSLITFYLFSQIFDPTNLTNSIEYLPIILGPMIILSIYFLTLELTSNHHTSIFASFLTITAFHILIGTYAGFYANWFSLIFSYLAILFLFKDIKNPTNSHIIIFSLLMIVTLLCHAPTWTISTLVITLFLVTVITVKPHLRRISLNLLLALLPSLVIDIIRQMTIKSSGVIQDISFAYSQGIGIHDLSTIWTNLISTVHIYVAGQFSNSIIFILVLYWLYISNIKEKPTILFVIFFSLIPLTILFGGREIQTRFFYEIPFEIPSAIALTYLKKNNGNIIAISICLWLLAISTRAVSNYYFIQR